MKEKLIRLIDECEVVSFDIFDTLIFRNIYKPTDLFRILENYATEKFKIVDFFDVRTQSEHESRVEKNNFECNFDEIYQIILEKLSKKDEVAELKKKELELELEFCVANPFMKDIFQYCIEQGKKVVLISDMYLEKDFIYKILNKNGYKKVDLYVSCEVHKNKGTSQLFEYVYEKNKFNKEKWIHIGDNVHSDCNVPREFGIKSFLYPKVSQFANMEPKTIMESILLGIQCNYLYNGKELDYWDIFGVKNISFIYFGFTKWLYDLTKKQDNLFFLARDGYIVDKIYSKFNKNKKVFTKYLYCSRKSVQIPAMLTDDKDKMIQCLTQEVKGYSQMTLREYLNNAQVSFKNLDEDLIKAFGFHDLEEIITNDNRYQAKKLVAKLYYNIKDNLKDDYDLAKKYLNQEGMNNFESVNIMDIGWGGSIQESLSKLLDKDVVGYYFGTIDLNKKGSFTNMFGYYFDLDYPKHNRELVYSNVMMYELIFSAPHGTTNKYQEKDGKIEPVFSSNVCYNKVVEQFQNSALNIIDEYLKYIDYFDELDREFCLQSFQEFLRYPSLNDLRNFTNLSNEFVLGSDKQFDYVVKVSREEIEEQPQVFFEKVQKSLWLDTFYIEDTSDLEKNDLEKLYLKARRSYNQMKYLDDSMQPLNCAKIYLDYGYGFKEENIVFVPYEHEGVVVRFRFFVDKDVKHIRIDPFEGSFLKIRNLIIDTNQGNAKVTIPHKDYLRGRKERCIYIRSRDPKILLKDMENLKWISFSAIIEVV